MEWMRQGRRPSSRSGGTAGTGTDAGGAWTDEELRVHPDGVLALAAAVIRQWRKDGRPKADEEGMVPWVNVIRTRMREHDMMMSGGEWR